MYLIWSINLHISVSINIFVLTNNKPNLKSMKLVKENLLCPITWSVMTENSENVKVWLRFFLMVENLSSLKLFFSLYYFRFTFPKVDYSSPFIIFHINVIFHCFTEYMRPNGIYDSWLTVLTVSIIILCCKAMVLFGTIWYCSLLLTDTPTF